MDVDNDPIDQNLLLQFTCLGTTDRDELVKQFIELIDNRINDTTASFFLEMNNWNLQNAICSFFDYETPRKLPSMVLEERKLLPDSDMSINSIEMPPNTKFTVMWTIRNNGDECWPHGCTLQYLDGGHPSPVKTIPVRVVAPGFSTSVFVEFVTPSTSGLYQDSWQMSTPFGAFFGEVLWVTYQVSDTILNETEEVRLSEELASRMALIDNPECKVMEEEGEIDTRPTTDVNPFSVSSALERKEQMSDIDHNDKEIS